MNDNVFETAIRSINTLIHIYDNTNLALNGNCSNWEGPTANTLDFLIETLLNAWLEKSDYAALFNADEEYCKLFDFIYNRNETEIFNISDFKEYCQTLL